MPPKSCHVSDNWYCRDNIGFSHAPPLWLLLVVRELETGENKSIKMLLQVSQYWYNSCTDRKNRAKFLWDDNDANDELLSLFCWTIVLTLFVAVGLVKARVFCGKKPVVVLYCFFSILGLFPLLLLFLRFWVDLIGTVTELLFLNAFLQISVFLIKILFSRSLKHIDYLNLIFYRLHYSLLI